MQLPWDEHFREIVIPAWQAYLTSETRLSRAIESGVEADISRARYDALREAGAATFYVHHFAEIVLRARPSWLPEELRKPDEVWEWLAPNCTMLREEEVVADVALLGDVADALKHAILTRRLEQRDVAANEEVLVTSRAYGEGRFGEGKYGGTEQVYVLAKSGKRALTSVLQNVIDAWRRVAGFGLPAVGLP